MYDCVNVCMGVCVWWSELQTALFLYFNIVCRVNLFFASLQHLKFDHLLFASRLFFPFSYSFHLYPLSLLLYVLPPPPLSFSHSFCLLVNYLNLLPYRGDVMNRCAKYLSKPAVSSSGQPVRVIKLIRKNFVEKHQLQSDLLSKISLVEGERVYFDSDRRHHKSDGIIFQPDSPYTFSIDSDLLKWKWSEVRSVDLQVVLTPIPGVQSGTKGNIHIYVIALFMQILLRQM